MVKRWTLLAVSLLMAALLAGCAQTPDTTPKKVASTTETVKLYFANADNDRLVTEEKQVAIETGADKYTAVLQALIKGPKNDKYRVNISPNTRIYGAIKQGSKLIVDVNKDFSSFGGSMAELLGVSAFVNTLTQFDEIDKVKILVEGEELEGPSGNPRGWMGTFPMQAETTNQPAKRPLPTTPSTQQAPTQSQTQRNVTLYFADQQGTALASETRTISMAAGADREDYIKTVLSELIKGPRNGELRRTIPAATTVRSVSLKSSAAYVDFSSDITGNSAVAVGQSLLINSITKTLTGLDFVSQVQVTAEGKSLSNS